MTLETIADQALRLTPWERIELAVHLVIHREEDACVTDDALARAWAAEVAGRNAEMASGRIKELPSNEFLDMLRDRIDASRASADQSGADPGG